MSALHDKAVTARSLAQQVADAVEAWEMLGGPDASPKAREDAAEALAKAEAAARGLLAVREQLAGLLLAEVAGEQAGGQGSLEVPD